MRESEFDFVYRIGPDREHRAPYWPTLDDFVMENPNDRPPPEDFPSMDQSAECVLDSMLAAGMEKMDDSEPEVVQVPSLQSMTNYIKFHYSRTISGELYRWIDCGEGGIWLGMDFPSACRGTVRIRSFDYWWVSRDKLIADVYTTVDVLFPGYSRPKKREYIVSLYFDFQNKIRLVEKDIVCSGDYLERENMFSLSGYLVPIFRKHEVDSHAEQLLQKHNKEAWDNQRYNDPEQLARKMGLSISRLPLHNCEKIRSILFFKEGTITTTIKDKDGKVIGLKDVQVSQKTIVINQNAVGKTSSKLDIYHECIHYEWHYMFFKLQDMYNNDLRLLEKKKMVIIQRLDPEKKETNPLCWLEFQAKRGSFGLWMPEKMMRNEISTRVKNPYLLGLQSGQIYQRIAEGIAFQFNIPKFRVRARLIQLGHWLAMGSLNYEDNHYVEPFSFKAEDDERDYTYFITRKQFYTLYQGNQTFRQQIDTGMFIYVEGHLCLNHPEYVYQTAKGPQMTKEALARVDKCCLRFKNQYWHDDSYVYCHGRLNCDDSYNQKFFYFPPEKYTKKKPMPTMAEQVLRNESYLNDMPRTFPKQLTKLMQDCNMTIETLASESTLSTRTINNYCSEKYRGYTLENVLALVFAMHLPPWVSEEFLNAAGFNIDTSPALFRYKCVLYTMFMDSVKTINNKLQEMGLRLIGEKKEKKLEASGEL